MKSSLLFNDSGPMLKRKRQSDANNPQSLQQNVSERWAPDMTPASRMADRRQDVNQRVANMGYNAEQFFDERGMTRLGNIAENIHDSARYKEGQFAAEEEEKKKKAKMVPAAKNMNYNGTNWVPTSNG